MYDTSPASDSYKDGVAAYSGGNYEKAADLFAKAYETDDDIRGLTALYDMRDWFVQKANTGDSEAIDRLLKIADWLANNIYNYADFGESDIPSLGNKAQELYEAAAQFGNTDAAKKMYSLALKFPADSEFFQKWMQRAAELGSEDAKTFVH